MIPLERVRAIAIAAVALAGLAVPSIAQTPRQGGTLVFGVAAEPNTFDCHASNTFAVLHFVAPHYSTLLRFAPGDYPRIVGGVAESWSPSPDRLTWTFRLREGVRFHDGSVLTAQDVKATFERLRNPPAGVVSIRRAQFENIAAIDAPDPRTVVMRLEAVDTAYESTMASPWNCIYSAALLARDPDYPERRVMGTGPFAFVEYRPGSTWVGRRFDGYFEPGLPHLDGFRAVPVQGQASINALAGGQIMAEFRGVSPAQRDRIRAARGERVRFHEGDRISIYMVAFNTERAPFNDPRVRRALNLAVDRRTGEAAMTRISSVRSAGTFLRPGTPMGPTAAELARMPGFGADMAAARAEARRLLAEAGQSALRIKLSIRNLPEPHQQLAVFLTDQWRQIGVTTENTPLENGPWQATLASGNYDAIIDFSADPVDDPTIQLERFTSFDRAPNNATRAIDRTLDALFERQRRAIDPAERRALVRDFEARVIGEAYAIPLFWGYRIIPVASNVQGWTFSPSHFLYQDLATVWLSE